ncbi:hypothetical protein JET14_20700 (plasmid) [Martelella lutilitoris]|uniref:Uncharacterized protein n=1 Tax=Martelella lutilitoris TaxID=2583532 RepID=A0A7T7HPG6_9HYPH|nr:hypothetical protein JET14_20700 [Martelella lutilitoris]QRX65187.1 hypothetical protein JS578_13245 [Dysgonomonadaceae bacterium zrk40]
MKTPIDGQENHQRRSKTEWDADERTQGRMIYEGYGWARKAASSPCNVRPCETRSWHGWHRHVSLVMLAFAMMATIRHHANAAPPPKTVRRIANRLARQQIRPAHIISWSLWRRAHIKSKSQL